MRDRFRDSPNYERTAHFIERYDNPAFDGDAPELSLSLFEPMVRRVFSQPKNSLYMSVMENSAPSA